MAKNMRKSHDAAFKVRVALEAIGRATMAQISSEYGLHTSQIRQWSAEAGLHFFR